MRVSVNQLAKRMGIDYVLASSILKLSLLMGFGKEVGKIKSITGKGKASTVYEVPDHITIDLSTNIDKRDVVV